MPKEKIAFISLLKPVDDIRSYRKMALSLRQMVDAEIHLYGYPSQNTHSEYDDIHFHPYTRFGRLSITRLITPLKVLVSLIQLKPKIIIVNTHELLIVTILNQILFGTKIVYDIQENYFYNLWYQQVYPPVIRHIMALVVRAKEQLLSPFFDHFILAERSYQSELKFTKDKSTLLENKALPLSRDYPKEERERSKTRLLFSGTITENTGIRKALKLTESLQTEGEFCLQIVGHCPESKLYQELQEMNVPWLELDISQTPIPYSKIEQAIVNADLGLVCYNLNPSNERCMPTKVYEYIARGLPVINEKETYWIEFIQENGKGCAIDFSVSTQTELLSFINDQAKSTRERKENPTAMWSQEEDKLKQLLLSILSKNQSPNR